MCLLLNACKPSSAGPNTWIDQPLNGSQLPFASVIIHAHASDADGISHFEFFIGEVKFTDVTAGGKNFEEANVEWQPLVPGEYTLIVRAIDKAGNTGPDAKSQVSIGMNIDQTLTPTNQPGLITVTPTPAVNITSTGTPTPAANITHTGTPTPAANITTTTTPIIAPSGCQLTLKITANCRAGPSTIFDVKDYLMIGDVVQAIGRSQDSGWFFVQNPKSAKECWLASSTVQIQCDVAGLPVIQAPALPTPTKTATEPAPSDTQAPDVSIRWVSPEQIVVQSASCTSYPQTAVVSALVNDPSGIAWVKATWAIGSENGELSMNNLGGGNYQATIGPVNSTGSLAITITAQDNAGNIGSTVAYVNVLACPE
jgi:hypothetical protein